MKGKSSGQNVTSFSTAGNNQYKKQLTQNEVVARTSEKLCERIGWSRGQISQYEMLVDKVATNILTLALEHQEGRVAQNATTVATYDFTERWFRDS
jgi:hypothetical protein